MLDRAAQRTLEPHDVSLPSRVVHFAGFGAALAFASLAGSTVCRYVSRWRDEGPDPSSELQLLVQGQSSENVASEPCSPEMSVSDAMMIAPDE